MTESIEQEPGKVLLWGVLVDGVLFGYVSSEEEAKGACEFCQYKDSTKQYTYRHLQADAATLDE